MRREEDTIAGLVVAAVRFVDALDAPAGPLDALAVADQALIDAATTYVRSLSPRTRARLAGSRPGPLAPQDLTDVTGRDRGAR